jgi:Na+-transporting methylmalonyl-CoA/oxaloacetate decarboxylase gamma subunit
MRRRERTTRAPDRGAAVVEAALVFPLLLLLMFGIIDFGRMLNTQVKISEAAREGARALSLNESASGRVAAVMGGTTGYTVDASDGCASNPPPGDDATVVVNDAFSFITPVGALAGFFGNGFGGTVSLSATGVMPCRA